MHPVTSKLRQHYGDAYQAHGATSKGVDWGHDEARLALRYDKMLAVTHAPPMPPGDAPPSLLDVGCGYAGLLTHAKARGIALSYTGIEAVGDMLAAARAAHPDARLVEGDVLELNDADASYDYVVCNGILTQKLDTPGLQMDQFAGQLIRKMFSLARVGIAFNVMTTKVNFFANNLYYRNPAELLSWCLTEVTPSIRIDHSYPLYEYTMYLYR
jgi:SAM-dependent methyltransferase